MSYTEVCCCGRRYYSTDGPCHEQCRECGEGFGENDPPLIDGLCPECHERLAIQAQEEAAEAGL